MVINNLQPGSAIGRIAGQAERAPNKAGVPEKKKFESLIRAKIDERTGVRFSKHALDRMEERGIFLTSRQMDRINLAVARAHEKGLKETLIMVDDTALVVSIDNRTVITVTDKSSLHENIFTNIDGAVFS